MGGGIGMGNTCKPMAVLFQCMTKFTTNKKKKNFRFGCEINVTELFNNFFPLKLFLKFLKELLSYCILVPFYEFFYLYVYHKTCLHFMF